MTPEKQKAIELCKKFDRHTLYDSEIKYKYSSQCALICLNEKLDTFYRLCGNQKQFWTSDENDYYKEIMKTKQELEKL